MDKIAQAIKKNRTNLIELYQAVSNSLCVCIYDIGLVGKGYKSPC